MAKMHKTVLETVGGTPLVEISGRLNKGGARVLAKIESFNPGGSVKDRIARAMVEDAEARGLLAPGATLEENVRRFRAIIEK
jgi:cysteine synthase A